MAPFLRPFALERFFARHEFTAPHLMCCSDAEPLHLSEVLQLAGPEDLKAWEGLRLSYTETQGLPALRQAVAERQFTQLSKDDLVVLAPEEGIYLTMRLLLCDGDHVIVSYPGYQSLYEVANSMGCQVSYWEPDLDTDKAAVTFNVQKLIQLIRGDTRMVVVNFPHNPTGTTLSHQDWQQLIAACEARGVWLFSDEMYRLLELDPAARLPAAADCYPKAISLGGVSKSLSLPGLRLGWLGCRDKRFVQGILQFKDYTTICSAATSEVLALIAVKAADSILQRNVNMVKAHVAAFQQLVDSFPRLLAWTPPAAGSVAFPRLLTGEDIEVFCDALVAAKGLLLLPSSVYDHAPTTAAGFFRLGLGRKDFMECLALLRDHLQALDSQCH